MIWVLESYVETKNKKNKITCWNHVSNLETDRGSLNLSTNAEVCRGKNTSTVVNANKTANSGKRHDTTQKRGKEKEKEREFLWKINKYLARERRKPKKRLKKEEKQKRKRKLWRHKRDRRATRRRDERRAVRRNTNSFLVPRLVSVLFWPLPFQGLVFFFIPRVGSSFRGFG